MRALVHHGPGRKATGAPETDTCRVGRRRVSRSGVVAVRDRLAYPPRERPADRYDVLASFPMTDPLEKWRRRE